MAGRPLLKHAAPCFAPFLTGVYDTQRSICTKLTLASKPAARKRRGRSCIIHSKRVGVAKQVRVSSAYLGLTNSGTSPWVASRHWR